MKKIGFIGAFEKTDLIAYLAKIFVQMGKRVLFIDATMLQKARYIIPAIETERTYVTTYEEMDVAIGFKDLQSVNDYLGNIESNYDLMLIDVDSAKMFQMFNMADSEKLYFVTGFDNYSLKRGIEIISNIGLGQKLEITKIMFEREVQDEYEKQLDYLSSNAPIDWSEEKIYFPYEHGDLSAIIENQRISSITYKNLTEEYRQSLQMLANSIEPELKTGHMKKNMRNA